MRLRTLGKLGGNSPPGKIIFGKRQNLTSELRNSGFFSPNCELCYRCISIWCYSEEKMS